MSARRVNIPTGLDGATRSLAAETARSFSRRIFLRALVSMSAGIHIDHSLLRTLLGDKALLAEAARANLAKPFEIA